MRYYYVATRAVQRGPFDWLCRDGLTHCYVLIEINGVWLHLDPIMQNLAVEFPNVPFNSESPEHWLPDTDAQVVASDFKGGWTSCLKWRAPFVIGVWTCTSICKAILGLRKPFIFTPGQLLRYLREQNEQATQPVREGWQPAESESGVGQRSEGDIRAVG